MSYQQKPIELKLFINGTDYSDVLHGVTLDVDFNNVEKVINITLVDGAIVVIRGAESIIETEKRLMDIYEGKVKLTEDESAAGKKWIEDMKKYHGLKVKK